MNNQNLYRKTILDHQCLRPNSNSRRVEDVINKLFYIQIDSLNIVNQAHHHTLWNRVDSYDVAELNKLVQEKKIFEYWFHAASYLPMHDYKFALVQMNAIRADKKHYSKNVENKDILYVLDKITNEGALKARDFKSKVKQKGSWWKFKPYKNALEMLFLQGDLMATRRDGIEKVYDLKSRILPDDVKIKEATLNEYALYLIESTLKAHGVTSLKQILHLRNKPILKKEVQKILKEKVQNGSIERHCFNNEHELFCFSGTLDIEINHRADYLKIISPFDNAVIHREKLKNIFDFDYKIECYLPKEKRLYGYFSLPILFNDSFVARVDCKAFRETDTLEIIHLHFEESVIDMDIFAFLFAKEIRHYALFNKCSEIILKEVSPKKYFGYIEKNIKRSSNLSCIVDKNP